MTVVMLTAPIGTTSPFTRTCTIPAGKTIFMPVAAYLNDYPCPDPSFKPDPGQSFDDFMSNLAAFVVDNYTSVEATLDGRPLRLRRITTGTFPFVGAADLRGLDSCITGSTQSGLIDGHFLIIDALEPGHHELQARSVSNLFGVTEGRFLLQVQ